MTEAPLVPVGVAAPEATAAASRHLFVVCAILTAAAGFIPIPFLDDWVREQIRRHLVRRLLRRAERSHDTSLVRPLWQLAGGGCVGSLWKLPLKLLLFPIRKIVSLLNASRRLSDDVVQPLLLGRALGRALDHGMLADTEPPAAIQRQAFGIARAFEQAVSASDLTVLRAGLGVALRGASGLPRAAMRAARRLAKNERSGSAEAEPADATVERGVGAVERVLGDPAVAAALADFDARFDAALRLG